MSPEELERWNAQWEFLSAQIDAQDALLIAIAECIKDQGALQKAFDKNCELALSAMNPLPLSESSIDRVERAMNEIRKRLWD